MRSPRQFSRTLWSKEKDKDLWSEEELGGQEGLQSPFNLKVDRGVSPLNMPPGLDAVSSHVCMKSENRRIRMQQRDLNVIAANDYEGVLIENKMFKLRGPHSC